MAPRKRFRRRPLAVLIGFLVLIPSLAGASYGGLGVLRPESAFASSGDESGRSRQKLMDAGVRDDLVKKVAAGKTLNFKEQRSLSRQQRGTIREVEGKSSFEGLFEEIFVSVFGVVIAGVHSLVVLVGSILTGLLGGRLTLRKKQLECVECGEIVALE